MRIGILGTRGIPNRYGGFEQFAEMLSEAFVQRGEEVWVYCSDLHDHKDDLWNGVNLVHCPDKENSLGTAGQFFYDLNCIRDAQHRNFDVLLHLGYTSDSIWHKRWPKNCLNIVNMDGLEWKRKKYNWFTRQFLKKSEAWAANRADLMIADNPAIKKYLEGKYKMKAVYIPYPVDIPVINEEKALETLEAHSLQPHQYYLAIARMEPENNLEMIIEGVLASGSAHPLVIIGNPSNSYGRWLVNKYQSNRVRFPGAIYEKEMLDELRFFSAIYFHGHSVGGTNPSLLEAMACGCRIAAHGNEFNTEVLKREGEYFLSSPEISDVVQKKEIRKRPVIYDLGEYGLEKIVSEYMDIFGCPGRYGRNAQG